MTDAKMIRVKEAAALANVSERTMRRWVQDRIVPSIRVRGLRLIPVAALLRLLNPTAIKTEGASHD